MGLNQNIKRESIAHYALILLAAMALSMAVVTDAVAAGLGGHSGGYGGSVFRGGHMGRGFRGPLPDGITSMPPPVFNPSSPYTLPESPESPVSPASPGSVFGNG
jgi:hypothetical protein